MIERIDLERLKIVFMHIPKCAGTTVHNFLINNIPNVLLCPQRFNGLHSLSTDELNAYNLFSGHTDFAGVRHIPGDKITITTLRAPKERIISLYNFWRTRDPSRLFKDGATGPLAAHCLSFTDFIRHRSVFVQQDIRNAMVRNFIGRAWSDDHGNLVIDDTSAVDLAFKNLASFDLIGFADDLRPLLADLSSMIGLEPPEAIAVDNRNEILPGDMLELSPDVDALLDELTILDNLLFTRAKALVKSRSAG